MIFDFLRDTISDTLFNIANGVDNTISRVSSDISYAKDMAIITVASAIPEKKEQKVEQKKEENEYVPVKQEPIKNEHKPVEEKKEETQKTENNVEQEKKELPLAVEPSAERVECEIIENVKNAVDANVNRILTQGPDFSHIQDGIIYDIDNDRIVPTASNGEELKTPTQEDITEALKKKNTIK